MQLQVYYDRTNRHEPNFGDLRNTFDVDFLQRVSPGIAQSLFLGPGRARQPGRRIGTDTGLFFSPRLADRPALHRIFPGRHFPRSESPDRSKLGTKLLDTNYTGVEPSRAAACCGLPPTPRRSGWRQHVRCAHLRRARKIFPFRIYRNTPERIALLCAIQRESEFQVRNTQRLRTGFRGLSGRTSIVDLAGFLNQYYDLFSEDIIGAPFVETSPPPTHICFPRSFGNGLMGARSAEKSPRSGGPRASGVCGLVFLPAHGLKRGLRILMDVARRLISMAPARSIRCWCNRRSTCRKE